MKKYFFGILSLLFLASCEKGTSIVYEIQNTSTKPINIKTHYNWFSTGTETKLIAPGQSAIVLYLDKQGYFNDSFECGQNIDSIFVSRDDTLILNLDLTSKSNWIQDSFEQSSGDVHNCICELKESHFE